MFSLVLPGRPCLTDMVTVSANQFAFNFPFHPHFSHVVVFILPGNILPDGTAAAVYMQLPGQPEFRFLGAIANEKPSAIFKVNLPSAGTQSQQTQDEMSDLSTPTGPAVGMAAPDATVSLGISVEPVSNIAPQLAQLKEQQLQQQQGSQSTTLVKRPPSTKILAQRIIKNAFNFLASFAGSAGPGGQEVVPLKSFEDWWKKFERRVENDPGFLERDAD